MTSIASFSVISNLYWSTIWWICAPFAAADARSSASLGSRLGLRLRLAPTLTLTTNP